MLMTLAETGTRALIGAVFGAPAAGEVAFALRLADRLRADMLVLADRAFDADGLPAAGRRHRRCPPGAYPR